MPHLIKVSRGRVKIRHMQRVKKTHTKTAGKLSLYGCGMEPESNLNKLRH